MSKQQTLFHHFASGTKTKSPRKENGNVTLQPARGQEAINQDDVTENFDDDLLLAACQDWEETTLIHPANESSIDRASKQDQAQQNVPWKTRLPSGQSPQNQPVPTATQLEDLPGFDASAGEIWIYPTNLPVRDYQYNIVQQALFRNTMVSLPTGLGKTLVAAVVMYNFYRWYPEGRVVFMAPTKPLVAQQIEACHNVMGIQQSDMAEMTGNMPPAERQKAWHKCRVFFLTPQVLMNDLSRRACPTQLVKCVVVDEAHKALGNHAYCQVVRELSKYSSEFRVLALSATPGSDLKAIQQVLTNLLISHIEIRSEDSIDIQRYVHERKVEKVVVPLDEELKAVRDQYLRILSVYVGRLTRCGALYNKDPASLTKFQILQSRDAFRQDPPPQVKSRGVVEGDFAICISLYHGFELLLQHGLRSLYSFLHSTVDSDKGFSRTRQELLRNAEFVQLMDALRDKFGGGEETDGLTNRSGLFSVPGTPRVKEVKPYVTSHPKMAKLQEIVLEHFRRFSANKESPSADRPSTSKQHPQPAAPQSTRVMIFAQYRDSVNEIAEMLNRHRPLLRCMGFVGQASTGKNSKGISQKEQLRVVKEFREGGYNTLVCTCVGEEGLDIGDVDLIVCYDAHKSPIRLVQRMGRTGRKRQGRIVMLVTEGKEAAIYDRSQYSKKGIVKALQGNARSLQLYPNSPRMVPRGLNPAPHKMFITVKAFMNKEAKRRSAVGASSETRMESFLNKAKSTKKSSEFLSPEELAYWSANYKLDAAEKESLPSMPDRGRFITLGDKDKQHSRGGKSSHPEMSLSEWSPWQMSKQPVRLVQHSHRCHQFVELMEFIDLQNMTEGDDIYGLEMQTYLDQDDIIRPRKTGIENYCTKLPKDPSDDGDHLKKASKSKPQEPSLLDTVEETSLRSVGKKPGHERAKRKNRPMELMSSPSESNHSDDYLPDVFQDENANLVLPEEHSKISTSAETNGMRSGTRSKKGKANESSTADKPRKHKQKRKHLRPVMDSSDGDDDFTSNLRQERACGDMKTISLERDPKVASSELDSALDEAHGSPNHKGTDVIYDTPEPMDTDSDNFLIFKIPKKTSEPVPGNDLSSSLLNKTEDDLSFMFPTQSVFFPSSSKKDDPKPSEIRTGAGKSVIPPPPPSLASLDLLDDIDTTFNLSQHFQSESNHFGGQREPKNQPTILASCEGSFKVGDTPSVEKLQESQANESKLEESLEEVSFGALKDVNGIVSDEQSKTFTNRNRSSHDGDEEIQIETTDNDELKKNQLKSLGEIEPHFDLNVDFTFISSDEEVEMSEQQDTNKDKRSSIEKPSNRDNDVEEIDLENVGDDNLESIFGTPQAFDVETPMVESTLTASVIPAVNLLQAFKLAGKETPCNISMAKSRKPLQSRVSKRPSSATPETPKSGLGARTKTSFAGRLNSDETNGPSCAGNEKFDSRRELDLEIPDASKIGLSSLEVGRGRVQQEEDPAETEKLRMEVLGSAEPKFDLGFDLDSLEEDGSGEEDDIVAPSPNMERQQEYINLSQVAIPKGQLGSSVSRGTNRFQARISSTPVSKADSQLKSVPCTDFLSPIATDRKPVTEGCPGFDAHPPNLRVNESESSQITPTKNKVTEPARRQGQMRKSLSLSKKSPQQLQTVKYCDVSSPSSSQVQRNVTEDALPHPARGTCEAEVRQSTNVRLTVLGKRKSAPVTNLADESPIGVKRRMSEPAKASPIQSIVHSSPDTGVFSLTDARIGPDDLGEMETVEGEVIVLDEEDKKEVEEPIKDQGRKGAGPTDYPPVDIDENEELSQPIQRRKRRKAVALQSPPTPSFKTPVRPATGGSAKKTTRAKPLVFSSDDDLESPLIRRPKKRRQIIMTPVIDEADEDFIDESSCKKDTFVVATRTSSEKTQHTAGKDLQMNRIKKQTKKNKIASSFARGFLEEDVVVSDGEEYSSDEEGSDLDNSLEGFINNASQLTQASQSMLRVDDMHAVYMQSVRSPAGGGILHPDRNRFKMVHLEGQQPVPEDMEIFSQVPVQDESYYENSFVVREGEGDGGGMPRGSREQFDESIFENTINPDNIISARRRRRRNQGPSRAEQILREGRRKVLMSSSSTSTSNEETDAEQRRRDKKMQSRDKRRGQKVSGLGATHSVENPDSSGWLSTDKSSKQKSSSLVGPRRGPVNYPQVSPVKRTNVLHSTKDSVRTYTLDGEDESQVFNEEHKQGGSFPSQSQGSVTRHFLAGNTQQSNSCPNVVPNLKPVSGTNRPTSSISKTAEVASNGLTLAEKERAERLRRQEEKKREFMWKMEERKRQQQQQQHKQSQEQVHSQQQRDQLKPVVQHFQQQPQQQLHQVSSKQQHQQLDAHQQQTLPQHQHQKSEIFAGRSSHSAGPGISEVRLKKIHQQAQNSSLEQHQHLQQRQKFKQTFEQQQQPLVKKNNVQQQKAEMYAGRAANSARASSREVQVKKMHPQAKSSSLELRTPPSSNASLAASAVSAPTHKLRGNTSTVIPAATMQGSRSPPMSPSSMRLIGKITLAGSQDAVNRGKPVILIDSKELSSSSHIVSTLTLKHNLNPLICQLSGCDYIVSARMGVEKKSMSDFGNGANKTKLIDRVRHLCELFDRPCIILEKDRIKPGDEKKPKQIIRTKYFDSTLAALSKTHIKVLYSDSLDDTARILADLVRIEMRKGEGLAPPTTRNSTQEQVFKFYQSLPRVNYATALSLMRAFPCVQQLINSTPEQLKKAANISHQRSAEICCFLQHQFDEQMISLSSGR
ncbi:uncharacterized protein LOC119740630 isoform X2 [Patiria miniata]|uniref:Fanconi anemia group M protein n=1 Tax=Patiria miniata TaxID=46514 RepID=A0A914B7H5_PATMI|nr:uncharacterized protein LOC119740630 isoform X2 [Patiria miniata]